MKSKLLGIAVILIAIAISAAGTYAYFTAEVDTRNVITSGAVGITVLEYQEDENGGWVDYPDEAVSIMPGSKVSKIVTVRSDEQDAFIRAKVEVTALDEDGKEIPGITALLTAGYQDGWVQKDPDDG